MTPSLPLTFKVVLVGSSGVGKSSILFRHKNHMFCPTESTLGVSFVKSDLQISEQRVQLQICDTAGQERFRSMAPLYYRNAEGAVAVYDITSRDSFDALKIWVRELIAKNDKLAVLCILANKCDLDHRREVSLAEGQNYANIVGASFFETSARTNVFLTGVDEAFDCLTRRLLDADRSAVSSDDPSPIKSLEDATPTKRKCC